MSDHVLPVWVQAIPLSTACTRNDRLAPITDPTSPNQPAQAKQTPRPPLNHFPTPTPHACDFVLPKLPDPPLLLSLAGLLDTFDADCPVASELEYGAGFDSGAICPSRDDDELIFFSSDSACRQFFSQHPGICPDFM